MRLLLVLCSGLLLMVSALGQEAALNRLSPKEVADGWLQLFDGETTFGWDLDGDATIPKGGGGVFILRGGVTSCKIKTMARFGDFVLLFDYLGEGLDKSRVRIGDNGAVLAQGGNAKSDKWLRLKVTVKDHKGTTEFDSATGDSVAVEVPLLQPIDRAVPIVFDVPPGSQVRLRNVKILPTGLQSIFNGKTLAGWKESPGKKSKFTVTPDGLINVKDGPGDLQTVEQWGNFVLQLDCISNGKHLNSGIFFRCIPGQYQQGYEAQIRNEFKDQPQEYVVEVYDPESNKLAKKEKVMSPAVDYGTGAIYRRMPARKQMSKDNEWFTMTVIAAGRHMATWVNGTQVVDWTDDRAKNENGRNGFRAEKGPISIQGHDPTTDLSFRNIRIVELPEVKGKKK